MRELGDEVGALFTQVLMTCDRMGLIGRELFAIDGVKLPSNASKERSGTHAELLHRAERLEKAADRIIETHRAKDEGKGHRFAGAIRDCGPCELRSQCLRKPDASRFRQVAINLNRPKPIDAMALMREAIDSPRGRALYGKRIGTVEPVFSNLRHNKRLARFTLRGRCRVRTQWRLYCLVNNIEAIARC